MGTTRRGFVGAALGAVAAPAVAQAAGGTAVAPLHATREVVRRGRAIAVAPRGGRLLVAHDRRRSVAILDRAGGRERLVDVGGQPVGVAVAPGARTGAVTTAFWDGPGLALLDLAGGAVRARADVGPAPGRVAFTGDGALVVVAGGEQEGTVSVVRADDGARLRVAPVGAVPRGIAITADDRAAWVALCALDRVVRVDLRSGRVTRTLRTPPLPDRLALSPHADRLLLTHADPRGTHVSEIRIADGRVRRHAAGPLPSAVCWTAGGRRLVALGGGDTVVVLGRRPIGLPVGAAPRDMAIAGRRVWTVSDLTGAVSAVRA